MASRLRHTENARGGVVRIDFCTHMTKVYIRSGFERTGSPVVHRTDKTYLRGGAIDTEDQEF